MALSPEDREKAQLLALDVFDLCTVCAAIKTTVKGRMPTTIRTQSKAAADDAGNPAIFYVASQGEETIWMGPAIENHVAAGRYVIVVLCTDGGASSVRASTGLSVQDFTAARDREMVAALARLGVPDQQIMAEHLFDGRLTITMGESIIRKYVTMFPSGSHKTTSWRSAATGASNLGYALHGINQGNPITGMSGIPRPTDVRFYIPRPQWGSTSGLSFGYEQGGDRTLAALDEYSLNNPGVGRYAVSQKSYPEAYTAARTDNRSLYHADDTTLVVPRERG